MLTKLEESAEENRIRDRQLTYFVTLAKNTGQGIEAGLIHWQEATTISSTQTGIFPLPFFFHISTTADVTALHNFSVVFLQERCDNLIVAFLEIAG